MKNFKLNRMNKRASFGTVKSVENDMTGDYDTVFVEEFSVWCGTVSQSMDQVFTNLGNDVSDDIVIAVRHDDRIKKTLKVKLDDVTYSITNINSDDGLNAFDTVTLKVKSGKK